MWNKFQTQIIDEYGVKEIIGLLRIIKLLSTHVNQKGEPFNDIIK